MSFKAKLFIIYPDLRVQNKDIKNNFEQVNSIKIIFLNKRILQPVYCFGDFVFLVFTSLFACKLQVRLYRGNYD